LIDNAIQLQGDPFPIGNVAAATPAANSVAAVPEPAAGAVVALASVSLLMRRRRLRAG
jgi:hypothetical protein